MTKSTKLQFILLSFLILSYHFSFGQENKSFSVSGEIKNLTNKQSIEFASVAIYKTPDTVLVTGTITNAKGEFVLENLSSGKYIIKSSFMGYHIGLKNVEIIKSSIISIK